MSKPWYRTARWRALRIRQLKREPLCKYCLLEGRIVAATIADHIVPHRWDSELFWKGELQSLCATHHSGSKQSEELGGSRDLIGIDGYPV